MCLEVALNDDDRRGDPLFDWRVLAVLSTIPGQLIVWSEETESRPLMDMSTKYIEVVHGQEFGCLWRGELEKKAWRQTAKAKPSRSAKQLADHVDSRDGEYVKFLFDIQHLSDSGCTTEFHFSAGDLHSWRLAAARSCQRPTAERQPSTLKRSCSIQQWQRQWVCGKQRFVMFPESVALGIGAGNLRSSFLRKCGEPWLCICCF